MLLELVTALHAEDTDRAYTILRDAGLERKIWTAPAVKIGKATAIHKIVKATSPTTAKSR